MKHVVMIVKQWYECELHISFSHLYDMRDACPVTIVNNRYDKQGLECATLNPGTSHTENVTVSGKWGLKMHIKYMSVLLKAHLGKRNRKKTNTNYTFSFQFWDVILFWSDESE